MEGSQYGEMPIGRRGIETPESAIPPNGRPTSSLSLSLSLSLSVPIPIMTRSPALSDFIVIQFLLECLGGRSIRPYSANYIRDRSRKCEVAHIREDHLSGLRGWRRRSNQWARGGCCRRIRRTRVQSWNRSPLAPAPAERRCHASTAAASAAVTCWPVRPSRVDHSF